MKAALKIALGIAITVICLYFAFRDVNLAHTIDVARNANYPLLLLSVATATMMFPLRARRWRTILDPIAPNLPFGPLWRSVAIGTMATNVLPLRAGEPARAFALSREVPSVGFAAAFASVAVDRIFDAIVVLALLAIGLISGGISPTTQVAGYSIAHLTLGFATIPLVAMIALYALVFFPETFIRIFEMATRRLPPVVERRGTEMLRRFAEGLSVLRTPRHFFAVLWWTLLHWLVQPVAFWLGMKAVGITAPWSAMLVVQGVIVILVALPSAPGFFGLFELGAKMSLDLYGVGATDAATWALLFHVATLIPITLIGAYYSARLGLSFGQMRGGNSEES